MAFTPLLQHAMKLMASSTGTGILLYFLVPPSGYCLYLLFTRFPRFCCLVYHTAYKSTISRNTNAYWRRTVVRFLIGIGGILIAALLYLATSILIYGGRKRASGSFNFCKALHRIFGAIIHGTACQWTKSKRSSGPGWLKTKKYPILKLRLRLKLQGFSKKSQQKGLRMQVWMPKVAALAQTKLRDTSTMWKIEAKVCIVSSWTRREGGYTFCSVIA